MNRLQAIRVCREVALQGGFAAAARRLNISTPSVSRLVSELEEHLGVRLFLRSTRQVSLTEEGEAFLARAGSLVDELDTVCDALSEHSAVPRGHLRVSSVVAFGQEVVAPLIPGFLTRYPDVTCELLLENRRADLIQENIDLAIRVGAEAGLPSSGLTTRRLYSQKLIFVATPDYIAQYGAPTSLDEVAQRPTVKQVSGNWGVVNRLEGDRTPTEFRMPEAFVVNSPNAAVNAVRSGQAMGLIGDYLVRDMLAAGQLQRLLPQYATEEQSIYAVFVHKTYVPAKLRLFLDHMTEALGTVSVTG